MNVSYKWLKELVEINVSAEEIAKKFLLSGLEVEGIVKTGIGNQNVIVAEILDVQKHQKADILFILLVDCGNFGKKQIITNLSGLTKGQKVLVGLEGVKLYSGFEIKKSKIKDSDSEGMLIRWEDLGLPYKGDFAIFIESSIKNGTNYLEIGDFEDEILEVELTANRGDCLGMIGVAREVSALFKVPQKQVSTDYKHSTKKTNDIAKVEINTKNCTRYCAGIIENVKIEPAPLWMQLRIIKSGIRPISNVVDLTNYIMMECNQPLHAFDMDKIKDKKVIVRDAYTDEKIVTLDNIERKLVNTDILITDCDRGHCIGGIMGGQVSEVSDTTKNIFLEAAFFKHQFIRKTSKRLGLKSESSYRFERITDKENIPFTLKRALYLFEKLNIGSIAEGIIDNYPEKQEKINIIVGIDWINNKLGSKIEEKEMIDILTRLEFGVTTDGKNLSIVVPSWRSDVSIKEDIAEEVARVYGYNNITPTIFPSARAATLTPYQMLDKNLRGVLYRLGCDEAFNLSLVGHSLFDKMKLSANHPFRNIIKMDIVLSDDLQGMRNSLIPGMIRTTAFNVTRKNNSISLFEVGNVSYSSSEVLPIEEKKCSVVLAGLKELKDYTNTEVKYDFYDIKGVADAIFDFFKVNVKFVPSNEEFLHPYQQAKILFNGKDAGTIGKIHPLVCDSFDIDLDVFILDFSVKILFENMDEKIVYTEIPKFPSSIRDLALIVPQNVNGDDILNEVKNAKIDILRSVRIFDIYRGENIEKDKYSIALTMEFNKIKSTLTDKEIEEAFEKVYSTLHNKFGAKIR